jgi:EmrB/QacA subfamily drug resistance transporter
MTTQRSAAAPPTAQRPPDTSPRRATLFVIVAGSFITTLDFFIVNVAIPSMQRTLHTGPASVQWVVAGFALALAAGLIIGGRLGDLYGRRRLLAVGLALFTVASAVCGFAPDAGTMVAGRIVQGAAAAIVGPQVLSIIGVLYEGRSRVRAFTAYGLSLGFAAVFGQLIGGALIRADIAGLGWRWCFLVNLPVGLCVLAVLPRLVPESRAPRDLRTRGLVDVTGTALVTLALVALVLPLVQGQAQGWPAWTWACLAASLPLLLAFWAHQARRTRRAMTPLIDLGMFRSRAFTAGVALAGVFFAGMASFFLVLTLYLQQGRGLSALATGSVFTPMGASYLATTVRMPQLAALLGRQLIAVGGLVIAAGQAGLLITVHQIGLTGSAWLLAPSLLVIGAGMGMVTAPLSSVVLAGVEDRHAGAASGVLSTMQNIGNAVGVAVIGVIFFGALGRVAGPATFPHAMSSSAAWLIGLGLAVAAGAQFLPRSEGTTQRA